LDIEHVVILATTISISKPDNTRNGFYQCVRHVERMHTVLSTSASNNCMYQQIEKPVAWRGEVELQNGFHRCIRRVQRMQTVLSTSASNNCPCQQIEKRVARRGEVESQNGFHPCVRHVRRMQTVPSTSPSDNVSRYNFCPSVFIQSVWIKNQQQYYQLLRQNKRSFRWLVK